MGTANASAVKQAGPRQSRTGKRPVPFIKGVQVSVTGRTVRVKGPKGSIERAMPEGVSVEQSGDGLRVTPAGASARDIARLQGLARALLVNMVEGVSKGFQRSLDLYGVGYRAELKGSQLTLALGLSHTVQVSLPEALSAKVEIIDEGGQKRPRVHLDSYDKELLGRVAAHIRSLRPPEPYKGKGVRYMGERIREKAGKAGSRK